MGTPATWWPAPVAEAFARRVPPAEAVAAAAEQVSAAARDLARRFAAGGTLFVFGDGPSASDAQHVAVEFLHPVIVGKRALPAVALAPDTRVGYAAQLGCLAHRGDIAIGLCAGGPVDDLRAALGAAAGLGLTTVALVSERASALTEDPAIDHLLVVPSADPRVAKEVHVTLYHLLWELAHVYLEQPATLEPVS